MAVLCDQLISMADHAIPAAGYIARALFPSQDAIYRQFQALRVRFKPAVMDILSGERPPHLETITRLHDPLHDLEHGRSHWGVYCALYEQDARSESPPQRIEKAPRFYIGSASGQNGIWTRRQHYDTRRSLSTNTKIALKDGYLLSSWGCLVVLPIPWTSQGYRYAKALVLILESFFTIALRGHWAYETAYGFERLEGWSADQFAWRGLATHIPLWELTSKHLEIKTWICKRCQKPYSSRAGYSTHVKICNRTYKCKQCQKIYDCQFSYGNHVRSCGLVWKCERCQKPYKSQAAYSAHVKICNLTWTCERC